jgi:hypothetical protein
MGKKIGGWIVWALAFGIAFWAAKYGVSYLRGQELRLTGASRDAFVGAAIRTCRDKQFNAPENANIAKPLLLQYCNCFANGVADRISNNRPRELSGLSDAQKIAEMKPVMDASDALCLQELEHSLRTAK